MSDGYAKATVRVEFEDGRWFEYDFEDVMSAWMPTTFVHEMVEPAGRNRPLSVAMVAGKQTDYREGGLDGKTQTGFRAVWS